MASQQIIKAGPSSQVIPGIAAPSNGKSCLASTPGAPSYATVVARDPSGDGSTTPKPKQQQGGVQAGGAKNPTPVNGKQAGGAKNPKHDVVMGNFPAGSGGHAAQTAAVSPTTSGNSTGPSHYSKHGGGKRHNNRQGGGKWEGKVAHHIAKAEDEYRRTEWYTTAAKKGFADQTALDRFNQTVKNLKHLIDVNKAPICLSEDGHYDEDEPLKLCACYITAQTGGVAVSAAGDCLEISTTGLGNHQFHYQWVDGIRRMFRRPNYDPTEPINHNVGWLGSGQLDEQAMLIPELLNYMRLYGNTSYTLNGVFQRDSKLSHGKKLALRWLSEHKFNMKEFVSESAKIARVNYTCQKFADLPDDDFLFEEQYERTNITSYIKDSVTGFWRAPGTKKTLIIAAAAVISPILVSKIVTASMRLNLFFWRRICETNVRILASGSISVVKSVMRLGWTSARVVSADIWSGVLMPCWIAIHPLLCSIARTTYTAVSNSGILNARQTLNPQPSIGGLCIDWPTALQSASVRIGSRLMPVAGGIARKADSVDVMQLLERAYNVTVSNRA